ncbi:MAG: glycosyltransferase [Rhodocyclaceae bacterium]|nr:glycosyltransferase [Rhodocyclaceae bacterium]
MTKRILLLDTGKEWGGGTNSMIELLKRLDRSRFAVTALFYYNYPKGDTSDLKRELAAIGIPLEIMTPPRQPVWAKLAKELTRGLLRPLPELRRRFLHRIERLWRINPLARRLAARLKEGRFDLLYLNNQPSSNLEGYLAARMAGLPVVQHCRIEAGLQPAEVDVVNEVAKRIICVSVGVKDSLVAQGVRPDLCRVVHNAIDGHQPLPEAASILGARPGTLVIGSVGSLIARKSNDQLLRAAAKLRERAPDFHLLLVGDGPQRMALQELAKKLGLADRITFAGFQTAPLPWLAAMDVMVLASAKEGLPRVILEAMLMGKPVVASDIVGSRELVKHGETGFLYPYGDEAALADCLERLLNDAGLRSRFGEAGRQRVLRDFSIESYVAGVEAELWKAS